jgi:hypothetical protein
LKLFYIWNGATSSDSAGYNLVPGITPVMLSSSSWSGLSLLKSSSSALQIGASYAVGNKGVRLGRISADIIYSVPQPPAAPSNLEVISTSTPITNFLTWNDNSSDELGFSIERGLTSSTMSVIATTSADMTSYNDTPVSPNTTYYYRVRAFNAAGNSGYSNVAIVTTPPGQPPADPSNLILTAITSTPAVLLDWSDNSTDENEFSIERGLATSTMSQIATTTANTSLYVDFSVATGTTYYYRVRAQNTFGFSGYSNIASTTTF